MAEISGWVKIYRKLLDWQWYPDVNVRVVFIHCVLKANHTDKQWRELTIERGSFVTSLQHLANENKLTVDQVRRVLNCLEKTGEITIKTTNKFTIISVSNYNTYQIAKTVKPKQNPNKTQTKPKQNPNKTQTKPKQIPTTKELKNERIKEEFNTVDQPPKIFELFEQFWEMYDKKTGKEKCIDLFSKIPANEIPKIIDHVPRYVKSTPIKKYRKNPETYLRNKCWNDEIVVETDFTKKQSKRELNLADVKESMRKRGFMNYDEQTNST
jgi:hypothetical protein